MKVKTNKLSSGQKHFWSQSRTALWIIVALISTLTNGCGWMQKQMAGEGFQPWSESLGKNTRPEEGPTQHSGFFLDRKAQQIEENLGGGF